MGQKKRVPFMDLKPQLQALRGDINAAIGRTLDNTDFILGEQLGEFESEFAAYCGTEHSVGVSSGTAALHIALLALDIGPGDEVITVPNTFVATVEAVLYTGATPVLVDVDERSFCIDPDGIERAITSRTKAIIPVHMYGQPCDMAAVMAIAEKHGVHVVEDACQAHGAEVAGQRVGSFGTFGTFSFYPTKNLGCAGDGGAVTTNDAGLAERVKALRHHAQFEPNVFSGLGHNYRLDSIQAGILSVKLKHLETWNERRRTIAATYKSGLRNTEFRFQKPVADSVPVFHILAVRHPKRSLVHDALDAAGIGWGRHILPPIHRQPGYRDIEVANGSPSVSERLSRELVSLPVFPELTDKQVDYVVEVLSKVEVSV